MKVTLRILAPLVFAIALASGVDLLLRAASENPFPARTASAELERIARALGDDLDRLEGRSALRARIASASREHGENATIRLVELDAKTGTAAPMLDEEARAPLAGRGVEPTPILNQTKQEARLFVYRPLRHERLAVELSRAIELGPRLGDLVGREAVTAFLSALAVALVMLMLAPRIIQKDVADAVARERELARKEADEREDALEELRRAERLSTVGRLASNLAHELGTPLNVISGRAMMIASGEVTGAEVGDNGKIIVEQAKKMTEYIKTMLGHARKRPSQKSPAEVEVCFTKLITLMGRNAAKSKVRIEVSDTSEPAVLDMSELELMQILSNLVTNAVQAMPNGGVVELGATRVKKEAPAQSHVSVWVRDRGIGIRKEDLPQIFKPFFTTRSDAAGTGLGLSIAQGIVRERGGWIDVETEQGAGSCFKVCIPTREGA